jgi:hypothetical protein
VTPPSAPYAVHLLRGVRPGVAPAAAVAADRAAGRQAWLVLVHDLVEPGAADGLPDGDVVVRLAPDCRRRGLAVPEGSLEYDDLVDLLAGATRVTGW